VTHFIASSQFYNYCSPYIELNIWSKNELSLFALKKPKKKKKEEKIQKKNTGITSHQYLITAKM
jgi:hypothetical protein